MLGKVGDVRYREECWGELPQLVDGDRDDVWAEKIGDTFGLRANLLSTVLKHSEFYFEIILAKEAVWGRGEAAIPPWMRAAPIENSRLGRKIRECVKHGSEVISRH